MLVATGSRSIVVNVGRTVSAEQAKAAGERLGVDWDEVDLEEFRTGLEVEAEHKDVTGMGLEKRAKVALAHLREVKDYYTRLRKYVEKKGSP